MSNPLLPTTIDLHVLRDLNESDLERLGVTLGDRKRLLRAIAELKPTPKMESAALQDMRAITRPSIVAERRS
jgi:SAM domain (Sterile alpha motif)